MSYLGLDIGTSGCKAAIFEEDGTLCGSAYRSYKIISSQVGFAELDSNEVIGKCFFVIRAAISSSKGSPVTALSISSQGEAFTPVGDKGEIIGNGMVSSDSRAAPLVSEWTQVFGKEKLYDITGHSAYSMFTLFKLLWLKTYKTDIWERTVTFHCYEDLMHLKLGLTPAISWPLAARTMLFDINTHTWSDDILKELDLDISRLPRSLPTGAYVGEIPSEIAKELGLSPRVKVYTGGHDQTVAALGAGVTQEGSAMYATGTVECICPIFSKPYKSPELCNHNLCCYDFTLPKMYTTVAYSLTGGNILEWFKNEFADKEKMLAVKNSMDIYELLFNEMKESPTDLLVLPYFTPSGTPHFDTETKGAILGLRLNTKRLDILRALLEGVALEMRLNMEIMNRSGIEINTLIATGGGTRSQKWVQLKADIFNKPIIVTNVEEVGCFGAAMIACAAETGNDLTELTAHNRHPITQIDPNSEFANIYDDKFAVYQELYPALKKLPAF